MQHLSPPAQARCQWACPYFYCCGVAYVPQGASTGTMTEPAVSDQLHLCSCAQAAQTVRRELGDLQQQAAQQEQKLEEKMARRLDKLKGSTPEALQIMREAVGDTAGHTMLASHGQVRPLTLCTCCRMPAVPAAEGRLAGLAGSR